MTQPERQAFTDQRGERRDADALGARGTTRLRVADTTDVVEALEWSHELVRTVRRELTGGRAVARDEIGSVLKAGLAKWGSDGRVVVEYPVFLKCRQNAQAYEVRRVRTGDSALHLCAFIHLVSQIAGCSEAIAIGFLLADVPLMRDHIELMVSPETITLTVLTRGTPSGLVAASYRLAAQYGFGYIPRQRRNSTRTTMLVEFMENRPDMSWKNRLEEWNRAFPEWQYSNEASIRVVHSRSLRREHHEVDAD